MTAAQLMPKAAVERRTLRAERLSSIDVLRGLVMVIMALDHTRDFFSSALFDPTDLTRTTPLLFFTRWITHFCAPVFVLLAGTGAYLSLANGRKEHCDLPWFLLKRGLWLMLLEVAVVSPLGWSFSLGFGFTRLQVIWVIGASMVVLAGLVYSYPPRIIAAIGLVLIAGHNLFDGPHVGWLGGLAPAWNVMHSINIFQPFPHKIVASLYPLIPWVGVIALGYGAGPLARMEPRRRRRLFLISGLSMLGLFVVLRVGNFYGDPKLWTLQTDWTRTIMSFVNVTKYPPSLLYLLITMGPALFFLAYADRVPAKIGGPLTTFGRVPLFYYLLHLPLLHGLAVVFSLVRYGRADWLYQDSFGLRGSSHPLPAGYGYDLWVVYLIWIGAVILLYPLCRWFAQVKRQSSNPLMSYL